MILSKYAPEQVAFAVWESRNSKGRDQLSAEEIDAEITAVRRWRCGQQCPGCARPNQTGPKSKNKTLLATDLRR